MKRIGLVVLTAAAATTLATPMALASPADAGPCVGGPGCYATLAQAIAAAPPGSTVHLNSGVFSGGVIINKDLKLVGEGPRRSIVKGGGPVIQIVSPTTGTPTVAVQGLTVTGGVTTGDENGLGGGIYIPRTDSGAAGANVTLRDVVVAGNKVMPGKTVPATDATCPDGPCPYAGAYGGGIENEGNLTLDHVTVAGNAATGHASESDGGGVFSGIGLLTVENSTIAGNIAKPLDIGRSSEGGGLGVFSGGLVIRDSRVDGNLAALTTSYPAKVDGTVLDLHASAGGIHIGDGVSPALLERTDISGNVVTADDSNGEIYGFDGAMQVRNSNPTMKDITVTHNVITVRASDSSDAGPSGTAMEFDGPGTLTNSRIIDNVATITAGYSQGTLASVTEGLAVYDFFDDPRQVTVSGTTISGNKAYADSPKGQALVVGVGVFNNSLLTLKDDVVQNNSGAATGPKADAQGGGIWNGPFLSGPPVQLSLTGVTVTGNSLAVHGDGKALGGGLYASEKVTANHTTISGNHPDDCYGTGCP